MSSLPKLAKKDKPKFSSNMIVEVFDYNFREEIDRLGRLLEKYNIIAMVSYPKFNSNLTLN